MMKITPVYHMQIETQPLDQDVREHVQDIRDAYEAEEEKYLVD